MKTIRKKINFLTYLLLICYCFVFLGATEHFFHEVLPEGAEANFFLRLEDFGPGFLINRQEKIGSDYCPFKDFLTAMEKSTFDYRFAIAFDHVSSAAEKIRSKIRVDSLQTRTSLARSPPVRDR